MSRSIKPTKLQLWRECFQKFRQRPQTIQAFCQSIGCAPATFHYWKHKLETADAESSANHISAAKQVSTSAFVPVLIRGDSAKPIVICMKNGTRIVVPSDAREALENILQQLSRAAT